MRGVAVMYRRFGAAQVAVVVHADERGLVLARQRAPVVRCASSQMTRSKSGDPELLRLRRSTSIDW